MFYQPWHTEQSQLFNLPMPAEISGITITGFLFPGKLQREASPASNEKI